MADDETVDYFFSAVICSSPLVPSPQCILERATQSRMVAVKNTPLRCSERGLCGTDTSRCLRGAVTGCDFVTLSTAPKICQKWLKVPYFYIKSQSSYVISTPLPSIM